MNDPVKCPDCNTWWRTDEHRCSAKPVENNKQLEFNYEYEKKTWLSPQAIPHILDVSCKTCGHTAKVSVPHKCMPYKHHKRQFDSSFGYNRREKGNGYNKEDHSSIQDIGWHNERS